MAFLIVLLLLAGTGAQAGELCFIPDSQGRNYSVDCAGDPNTFLHEWSGYNTGQLPCNSTGVPGYTPCSVVTRGPQPLNDWYGWTLSSSATDPFAWQGPLSGAVSQLYLHLACVDIGGLQAAAFEISGDLVIYAFTPMNGFLNAGNATNILLATACITSSFPVVAGVFFVEGATSAGESWESSSWGRVKSQYR